MKFKELFEKRSVDLPHENFLMSLRKYIKLYNSKKLFMQYTNLEKFGINPINKFNTPIGIYAYQVYQYEKEILNNVYPSIPFAYDRKFVNLFTIDKNANIIRDFTQYKTHDLTNDVNKLIHDPIFNTINQKEKNNLLNTMILDAENNAYSNTPFGKFWNITRMLSIYLADNQNNNTAKWTKLLKICGYDGFVDYHGAGIIHDKEPKQALFINIKKLQFITRLNNEHLNLDINKFLNKICKKWWIDGMNSIHTDDNVTINKNNCKSSKLPVTFYKVKGNFTIEDVPLTTLDGSPSFITGDFICINTEITNLKNAPYEIEGNIIFKNNKNLSQIEINKYIKDKKVIP